MNIGHRLKFWIRWYELDWNMRVRKGKRKFKEYLESLPQSRDTVKYCHDCEYFILGNNRTDEDFVDERASFVLRHYSYCVHKWTANMKVRVVHTVICSNDPQDYTHELPSCVEERHGDCGLNGTNWKHKE